MKLALSRKNAWNRVPRAWKAALAPVLGALPLERVLGGKFRRQLQLVRAAQYWSREQARAFQVSELRRICNLAYERTPFYRRLFDEAGFHPDAIHAVEDVRRLPTIDRHTLAANLDGMCAVSPNSPHVDYVTTGGTGGMPLRFYIGAGRSAVEHAHLTAGWERAGFRPGATLAVFRGREVPPDRTGLRHEHDPLLRHHYYSSFHLTDETMGRYLDHVRRLGPCFLHVYPSSIAALARFLRRANVEAPSNVQGILAESEIVYPDQRRLVEDTFPCRYFSSYGLTEKVVAASECEHSTHYHVWPTYGLFELLDERGLPVSQPGQRGEIVGTGFLNTVVPFIRYRTGDYATYIGERCDACGREQPILADIRGHRIQESLIASDGAHISWTAMNMHDDTFDHVIRFQFYQDTPGRALLRIVPAEGFSEADERRIRRNLDHKLDGRLDLSLEVTSTIPLSPMGKAIYVDQRTPGLAGDGLAPPDQQERLYAAEL